MARYALRFRSWGWILLLGALGSDAAALPTLSVDLDPGRAGVQSQRVVGLGSVFSVHVTIAGLSDPLQTFELDLGSDPSVLAARAVFGAGFLLAPTLEIEADIVPPEVGYAETSLAAGGVTGAGVLVAIDFEASLLGDTLLDLNDVLLSGPFAVPIPVGALEDARITVASVPEPASLLLLGAGLAGLAMRRPTGARP